MENFKTFNINFSVKITRQGVVVISDLNPGHNDYEEVILGLIRITQDAERKESSGFHSVENTPEFKTFNISFSMEITKKRVAVVSELNPEQKEYKEIMLGLMKIVHDFKEREAAFNGERSYDDLEKLVLKRINNKRCEDSRVDKYVSYLQNLNPDRLELEYPDVWERLH